MKNAMFCAVTKEDKKDRKELGWLNTPNHANLYFKLLNFSIQRVYVFRMILTMSIDYLLKQH